MASRRNRLARAAELAKGFGRSQPKNQRTHRPGRRDRRCRKGRVAMSDEAKFRWLWERSFGGACHQNIGDLNKFLIRFCESFECGFPAIWLRKRFDSFRTFSSERDLPIDDE